jgi:hypothetical protein
MDSFDSELLYMFYVQSKNRITPFKSGHPVHAQLSHYINEACDEFADKDVCYNLHVRADLYLIFTSLLRFYCGSKNEQDRIVYHNVLRLRSVIDYIDLHYAEKTYIEKLSGMSLFDYLYSKIFTYLGTFKTATVLKTPNGDSWGDSAMLCTPRDIMSFARFVMNYGVWEGKRLMNEGYLREATSKVVDNREGPRTMAFHHGYGYQIWRTERNAFAFVGMGNELTVCLPDDDVIFVCTADCQGDDGTAREYIINHFFDFIMDEMEKSPLAEDPSAYAELCEYEGSRKLFALFGEKDSSVREKINGREYALDKNPMGIKSLTFKFENEKEGKLCYENAQGVKELPFKINENAFCKFPQLGYSNDVGGMRTTDGFMYDAAVSATWLDENKLMLYIQIIDRYLGTCNMTFAFKNDKISVVMRKCAEDFLDEYCGYAVGCLK